MTPAELIGAKVGHVMVHDAKVIHLIDGVMVQYSGAVDIWTEGHAIVLRSSQLRDRCPLLSSTIAGGASTGATVKVCSHEEAARLSSRLSPRWEPMLMRQVIAAFNPDEASVCLRSCNGQDTWITYREDFDGVWLMSPRSLVAGTAGCYDAGP